MLTTHLTIISVTVYLHRAQSHRGLDVHPALAHVFRLWLWMTTGMTARVWASIHRKHHAKCETEEDPHSPVTRGLKTVLLSGAELYKSEAKVPETMEKYGHGTPNDALERFYVKWHWHGVGATLVIFWALFGMGWGTVMWAGQMSWIPVLAAGVINGIGHYFGYRNFASPDASRNIVPWGILIGGEELHNNHHTFATSPKLSAKPWEFDLGWFYIKVLSAVGLVKIRNLPTETMLLAQAKPVADEETLNGIIAHRYALMHKYGSMMKATLKAERDILADKLTHTRGYAAMKNLLAHEDESTLSQAHKSELNTVLQGSKTLEKLHAMRTELALVWARSSASREQLVAQLQDWCTRAEASGIAQLQELSLYVRRVTVKPVPVRI